MVTPRDEHAFNVAEESPAKRARSMITGANECFTR
jgi:hypothetical protein